MRYATPCRRCCHADTAHADDTPSFSLIGAAAGHAIAAAMMLSATFLTPLSFAIAIIIRCFSPPPLMIDRCRR